MARRIGHWARAAVLGARTAWDILGITLLLLVVVVIIGRGAASLLRAEPPPSPPHPYGGQPWFRGLRYEYVNSNRMQWEPYVQWRRRPYTGPQGNVNIDSAGLRRTTQPAASTASPRKVFFFGGSTMWGSWQRDSFTIASLVAADLAARGVDDIEVRNYGETGYVLTQEVIRLILELRRGERPALVVFYDGINDIAAEGMNLRCGLPQNEANRRLEFAAGRLLARRSRVEIRDAAQAWRDRYRVPPARSVDDSTAAALARDAVACYAGTAEVVEALARAYGFQVLYFWQPTIGASEKPLTAFERYELDPPDGDIDGVPIARPIERASMRYIDSAMGAVAGDRFHNLGALFAGDTATVWLDFIGHITERANQVVAGRIAEPVYRQLQSASPSAATAGSNARATR